MSFLNKGTITDGCRPYVLQLSRARLPNISVTKAAGCVLVQPGGFHRHAPFHHALPRNVCSTFALVVWISTFLHVCALIVLLPLTIPPRESFPVQWFSPDDLTTIATNCFHVWITPASPCAPLRRHEWLKLTASLVEFSRAEDALRRGGQSIVSARGRSPARYCASNARKAAVTVAPIPTIPSSTVGPSSAIHSSPRTNNLGRRTADGLPG
jgi:hypothetical protein